MLGVAVSAAGGFGLALLGTLIIALVVGAAHRWPGRAFSVLMLMLAGASVGTIMLSGRIMRLGESSLITEPENDGAGGVLAKMLLVAAVGGAVALCVAWLLRLRKSWAAIDRFGGRTLRPPTDIVVAFMCFYVAFSILPIFFGQEFFFHVSLVYPFFVFLALFLWFQVSTVDPVVVLKQCLGLVVFLSLATAAVVPELAIEPGYIGLLPGYNIRLLGVTASANTLGSVGSALLLLEIAQPSARKWVSWSTLIGAATVLGMSQSKTSIMAALLGVAIIFTWRSVAMLRQYSVSRDSNERRITTTMLAASMVAVVCVGAWSMFVDGSMFAAIEGRLNARAVGDLKTATGRSFIWQVAIDAGMANPLFGQGGDFWNTENRIRLGLSGAVHAHSLYLQAFSRSGFVGLGALLVFLYFLLSYSFRAATITGGGSIALLAAFLVRSVSEVPIQPNAILGGEFFAFMALLFYVVDKGAKPLPFVRSSARRSMPLAKA